MKQEDEMEWFEKLYTKDHINLCGFSSAEQTRKEAIFVATVLGLNSDSTLLDLCCGFGRHAFEISNLVNCSIIGVDFSDDYLNIARENYSSVNIKYQKGDMRNLKLVDKFDAVTNLFTSFGFFDSEDENEKVMQQVNNCLKMNGFFLLDIENKFHFVSKDVMKERKYWKQLDENKYCLIRNSYDLANEREIFTAKIIEKGKKDINVEYNIRLYSLPELVKIFTRYGFILIDYWGDFDKSSYSIHSRRLITLAQKTRNI